jgi:DNA-binding HxlR family transcriptional regulator
METLTTEYFSQKKLREMIRPVTDTLYVLNGKWKLPILITLTFYNRRFGELAKDIPQITDRMLSRELRELETNLLVTKVFDTNPTKVLYSITDHGKTLHNVIVELSKWGLEHRKAIISH